MTFGTKYVFMLTVGPWNFRSEDVLQDQLYHLTNNQRLEMKKKKNRKGNQGTYYLDTVDFNISVFGFLCFLFCSMYKVGISTRVNTYTHSWSLGTLKSEAIVYSVGLLANKSYDVIYTVGLWT